MWSFVFGVSARGVGNKGVPMIDLPGQVNLRII